MKKLFSLVILLALVPVSAEPEKERAVEISRDEHHKVLQVKRNTERLTKNWMFVVDSSHSTWQLASKILTGFRAATQMPTDHLRFATVVFNNQGCHQFRDWKDASPEEFKKTERFVRNNRGVNSYAARAIKFALRQPKKDLTVIIISDGGFSDGGGRAGRAENQSLIQREIQANQVWRVKNGYGRAVITTIGIENFLCWPHYPKATNAQCMRAMKNIGVTGKGGFFYVQALPQPRKTAAR